MERNMEGRMESTAGIMIAAVKSGSGKTTITCALLEALKRYKRPISAFKCGPDYIDPMFHKRVIGVDSRNLDTFFSNRQQIQQLYLRNRRENEISVVEGVMGLFDGLGGIREEGSAYDLAEALELPIILVLDAHGMGRTMVAVLAGILQYDTGHRIAGVILNRTSEAFYQTIVPVLERELSLPVLGFFPKVSDLHLESRHLGLKLPNEIAGLQSQVRRAAEILCTHVDVEKIIEIADSRGKSSSMFQNSCGGLTSLNSADKCRGEDKVRIAVAMDEAFCFYYADNLRMLEEAGAQLVPFSPLWDAALPEDIQGLLLGGGYPELAVSQLAANQTMRASIYQAIRQGIPSVAECGGFMYLHEFLQDESGKRHPMVGIIPGTCSYRGKLVRFGYVEISEGRPRFLSENLSVKAHEFHYYDSDNNGTCCIATKPVTGKKWECIHTTERSWWGYPHLYYPSNPEFVEHFVHICRKSFAEETGIADG